MSCRVASVASEDMGNGRKDEGTADHAADEANKAQGVTLYRKPQV